MFNTWYDMFVLICCLLYSDATLQSLTVLTCSFFVRSFLLSTLPNKPHLFNLFPVVLSWTLTFIMPTETVESEMWLLDLLQFLWALHRLTLEWIYWDDCVIVLNHAGMLQTDKLLKLLLLQRCSHLTSSYGSGEAVLSFSWLQRVQWKLCSLLLHMQFGSSVPFLLYVLFIPLIYIEYHFRICAQLKY